MADTVCRECGEHVERFTRPCPRCGEPYPLGSDRGSRWVAFVFVLAGGFVALLWALYLIVRSFGRP